MKEKLSSKAQQDLQRLAGLLTDLPEEDPPDGLMDSVMARIRPRRLSVWRRAWLRLRGFSAARPLQFAAAATAALALALWMNPQPGPREERVGVQGSPPAGVEVVFMLELPEAGQVELIGSFNGWRPQGYRMERDNAGNRWVLAVRLSRGRHEYAFLIDRERVVSDPGALLEQDDGFGNRSAVLIVNGGTDHEDRV